MTLASPSYRRLLAAEPRLRRLVVSLLSVFLIVTFAAVAYHRLDARSRTLEMAGERLSLVTSALETRLAASSGSVEAAGEALRSFPVPKDIRVGIVDRARSVSAGHLSADDLQAAEAMRQGEAAGSVRISSGDALIESRRIGTMTLVAAIPFDAALSRWRTQTYAISAFALLATAVLFVLGFAYYRQTLRTTETDRIYASVHKRLEAALACSDCGLWDWDLASDRLFWSESMFHLLGYEARSGFLSGSDVERLLHPDDLYGTQGLYSILRSSSPGMIDRRFRMRRADAAWAWVRVRGNLMRDAQTGHQRLVGLAIDETEDRLFEQRTKHADLRLRDAIEALSEAFVLWDTDNRLVLCNSRFRQLHRIPEDMAVQGVAYADMMRAGAQPMLRSQQMLTPHAGFEGRTFEAQLDDGRWLTINERRTRDGGYVSVGTDITSLKEQQNRLLESERQLNATISDLKRSRHAVERHAKDLAALAAEYEREKVKAEAAHRAKAEFLANMSHELRTPLNAIIGFSELMESGAFGPLSQPRYVGYCRDIHDSGQYLLDFVDDVLEMSKIESGDIELKREVFAVDRLIADLLRGLRDEITAKGLTLRPSWPAGVDVCADRRALRLIARNILSNAVKFTPEGGTVTLRIRQTRDKVSILIADTGIGIPAEAIGKLGRPFEQVQSQFTKGHRGSGLGLSIAKSLTELHGGTLRIRSVVDVGTAVMIVLPAAGALIEAKPVASAEPRLSSALRAGSGVMVH